ncbi:S9 family peptidase [candidate division KSB1 bacterium]|nr:S9 family peptidase [candidate division KSB1 bacterium]
MLRLCYLQIITCLLLLSSAIQTSAPAGSKSVTAAVTAEDLYAIEEITDIALSPDNRLLAYVVRSVNREKNQYRSSIWILPMNGGTPYRLTSSSGEDTAPAWSPDSRMLAFASTRGGKPQIWLISVDANYPGEAWTLTTMPNGAFNPAWSPDGGRIAFLSSVTQQPTDISGGRLIDSLGREYAADVNVITRLRYRQNQKYLNNSAVQIFTIPINGGGARQITFGMSDALSPVWSPDSKKIAFVSNRRGDPDFDNDTDICIVPAESGEIQVKPAMPGYQKQPVWSPNGEKLAFIGTTRTNDFTEQAELWVIDVNGETAQNLTRNLDRMVSDPQWLNEDELGVLVDDRGNRHLYRISQNAAPRKMAGGRRQITQFAFSKQSRQIVFCANENTNPGGAFIVGRRGENERQVIHLNQDFCQKRQLVEPEEFSYRSDDSLRIHGWLMKPPQFTPHQKYPLIVQIHGGPYWHYGNRWMHEFQFLASRGYAIFYCNPRVSTSYGQVFAQKDHGQWGMGDFHDIMAGVAVVLEMGFVDSSRLGVTGGSYGGFMTNWIVGHTNRFKAAVTQRSLSNLISFYGTTDIQNFVEFEFGQPWENAERFLRHSPVSYIHEIRTPLLILHSEDDYRVPISQAEELYIGLKRCGVETVFVRYPDEGHELSRSGQPLHRVDRLNRIADWFDLYLK